jgi:flagellar motor switch protein FliM
VTTVLSQAEVDALLGTIQDGYIELETMDLSAFGNVVPYDFSKPHSLSRVFAGNLATVADSYAKAISISLSNYYRSTVSASPKGLRHILFQDYIERISKPSCISIINLPPLRGQAVLDLDLRIVFALVDKLMGGGGKPIDEPRDFTDIEYRVSAKIIEKLLADLSVGSDRFVDIKPALSRIENNPEFVNICTGTERVISLEFEINMGDFDGMLSVCIPISAFEPVIDRFNPVDEVPERSAGEKSEDMRKLRETLSEVKLEVCVQIGRAEIPIARAKNLKEGDILVLDRKTSDPIDVLVEDIPKFLGIPGTVGARKAVKLVSIAGGGRSGYGK